MSEWKARRFWKTVVTEPCETGWHILLDGKRVMTPGKQSLILPTSALAQAVASEWDAQQDVIDPSCMPLTRAANSAIEKIIPQFSAVADMLGTYGQTDLLCYRASEPERLCLRQRAGWDPILDWAEGTYGAKLSVTSGVMPVAQDPSSLATLRERISRLSNFELTALHDLVTLPGSLILGLAVLDHRLTAAESHSLSRIDEEFQAEAWGRDAEADLAADNRLDAMKNAENLLELLLY